MKKPIAVLLILVGLLSVILGFSCRSQSKGNHTSYSWYGGDAYTGIQQAGADTANNVRYMNENLITGFFYVLLIGGLVIILVGVNGLLQATEKRSVTSSVPEDHVAACVGARTPKPAAPAAPAVSAVPSGRSPAGSDTVTCPKCGGKQKAGKNFCVKCGAGLVSETASEPDDPAAEQ